MSCVIQVQKMRQVLEKKRWSDVTVGSVEEFQGQERLAIIISTVRSSHAHIPLDYEFNLGFLRNPKVRSFVTYSSLSSPLDNIWALLIV